ncbi:MAG: 50S ribosomal protein L4 [Coriobacteriales bacterium]|jgi:large subunit ribosomal protein L4|nr:50S ribosomal protein L4 [Coriobacteriales bacterium]
MATINITDTKGKKLGTTKVADSVFAISPNIHVMHMVVRAQQAAKQQGTHSAKSRGEVSGGGRKPFRQKGTGRARQGSTRSPHYRGGGIVFGPTPRSHAIKVNRKEVKLAMKGALSAKLADNELMVIDDFAFEMPSTKEAAAILKALEIARRVTIVLPDNNINAFLSFRNIPRVRVIAVSESNTRDFLDNSTLLFTTASLKYIEEVLQ